MHTDNKEKTYCDDDGEYKIYCHICEKIAIDRYYKNHLKSQLRMNNFRKEKQLKNTSNSTSSQ